MGYADRQAQRDYQRAWCRSRRQAYLDGKACIDCGAADSLEIHHVDPAKKIHHAIWSWGERRRVAELDKCVVLCVDCHRKHTSAWRLLVAQERNPCGTIASYGRGCRCEPCRSAKRVYERDRIARRAA